MAFPFQARKESRCTYSESDLYATWWEVLFPLSWKRTQLLCSRSAAYQDDRVVMWPTRCRVQLTEPTFCWMQPFSALAKQILRSHRSDSSISTTNNARFWTTDNAYQINRVQKSNQSLPRWSPHPYNLYNNAPPWAFMFSWPTGYQ